MLFPVEQLKKKTRKNMIIPILVVASSDEDSFEDEAKVDEDDDGIMVQLRVPQVRKQDLWVEYKAFCRVHGKGSLSQQHFLKMWREEFSYVKCSKPKGTFSMCNTCSGITGKLKRVQTEVDERY